LRRRPASGTAERTLRIRRVRNFLRPQMDTIDHRAVVGGYEESRPIARNIGDKERSCAIRFMRRKCAGN
jgi:hypothetical protein